MNLKNCNAEEFMNRLGDKKLICFGAGSTLMNEEYSATVIQGLEKKIAFFVDNDTKKHGLKFKYRGCEFDIKSVSAFDTIQASDYVILITCAFYVEVYRQLREIEALKDVDCYLFNCVYHYPEIDIKNFLENEIEKRHYKEYKEVLSELKLKDKHKGERCFIIGNGPSLTLEDLELLKNEVTFAANRIVRIFPKTSWRPTYYCCIDYTCYGLDHKEINEMDAALRFIPVERAFAAGKVYEEVTYYNRVVSYVGVENGGMVKNREFQFSEDVGQKVYGTKTVLYDMLQFAVYMGFKEIYLLGVDHTYRREVLEDGTVVETGAKANHFCEKEYDQDRGKVAGYASHVYLMEQGYKKAKEVCEKRNITIKNATRGGRLEVFERVDLESVLFGTGEEKDV